MAEHEQRQRQDLVRHQQGDQDDGEEAIPPRQAQLGERIGSRCADQDLQHQDRAADDDTVEEKARDRAFAEGAAVVGETPARRQERKRGRENLAGRLDRKAEHPGEGNEHEQGRGQQRCMTGARCGPGETGRPHW